MSKDFTAEVAKTLEHETREGLSHVIRHCRITLTCELRDDSRAWYEALRDGAIAKLDAIMRAEAEAEQAAGRAKRLPE